MTNELEFLFMSLATILCVHVCVRARSHARTCSDCSSLSPIIKIELYLSFWFLFICFCISMLPCGIIFIGPEILPLVFSLEQVCWWQIPSFLFCHKVSFFYLNLWVSTMWEVIFFPLWGIISLFSSFYYFCRDASCPCYCYSFEVNLFFGLFFKEWKYVTAF